ncbi:hypothetical protein B0H13DRAFT_1860587 [Mycena leptocephala]|nr:hypothetical protein B0H13DRAFT_1860587 [Mycena leptocephala]
MQIPNSDTPSDKIQSNPKIQLVERQHNIAKRGQYSRSEVQTENDTKQEEKGKLKKNAAKISRAALHIRVCGVRRAHGGAGGGNGGAAELYVVYAAAALTTKWYSPLPNMLAALCATAWTLVSGLRADTGWQREVRTREKTRDVPDQEVFLERQLFSKLCSGQNVPCIVVNEKVEEKLGGCGDADHGEGGKGWRGPRKTTVLDTAAPDRRGDAKEEVGHAATEKEKMGQGNPMQTWACGEEGRVREGWQDEAR